jgi:hypothetical protein
MERHVYDVDEKDIWKEISTAIRSGNCILLAGLGFSLLSLTRTKRIQFPQTHQELLYRMHNWGISEELTDQGKTTLNSFERLLQQELFKDAEHIIAGYLADESKKQACLKAILEQNQTELNYIARLIAQISFRAYLTTGYDTFIEDQYSKVKGSANALARYDKTSINRAIADYQRNKPFILKLHDDINSSRPIVPSKRIEDIPYPNDLRKILSDSSALLIGFAKADPDLGDLQRLLSIKENVKHWLLVPKRYLSTTEVKRLWEKNRIITIEYTTISDLRNFFIEIEELSSAPREQRIIEIYVSYADAPKDKKMLEELGKHFRNMKYPDLAISWSDGVIGAGEEVEPEIERRLNAAKAMLLLVSADYLDSLKRGNIEKEIGWAVERHEAKKARVIPIILRHCPWEDAPFAKLQVLPTSKTPISVFTGAKRDQVYKEVAKGIREAIMEWITKP